MLIDFTLGSSGLASGLETMAGLTTDRPISEVDKALLLDDKLTPLGGERVDGFLVVHDLGSSTKRAAAAAVTTIGLGS